MKNTIAMSHARPKKNHYQTKITATTKSAGNDFTAPIPQARKQLKKIIFIANCITLGIFCFHAFIIAMAMYCMEDGGILRWFLFGTLGSVLAIAGIVALQYIKIACFNVECEFHEIRNQMYK